MSLRGHGLHSFQCRISSIHPAKLMDCLFGEKFFHFFACAGKIVWYIHSGESMIAKRITNDFPPRPPPLSLHYVSVLFQFNGTLRDAEHGKRTHMRGRVLFPLAECRSDYNY